MEIVRLRGHHLICLHFFRGHGYSASFVVNLKTKLELIQKGVFILIVSGTDDICLACPYNKNGVCVYRFDAERRAKKADNLALKLLEFKPKQKVKWYLIKEKLPYIMPIFKQNECKHCRWLYLCKTYHFWRYPK
jgi:hypothetical protein